MCNGTNEKKDSLGQNVVTAPEISRPERIKDHHDVDSFSCGQVTLDDFLRKKALDNERRELSATYVACYEGSSEVAGYFSLASGAVIRQDVPKNMQRNTPGQIPVAILGRLAVHQSCQGIGLGTDLLHEAVKMTLAAASHVAVHALLVHALDETAAAFYKRHGFVESPHDPMLLLLPMKSMRSGEENG